MHDLSGLFEPSRVVLIGADDEDGSVGRSLVENLTAGYDGEVHLVNPNLETVLGHECHPDVGSVPDPAGIDLAVVAVPAQVVSDVLQEIGEAGIENVVVITAGFSEAGPEGEKREAELVEIAREYDLTLVGPNCLGIIGTPVGLNATFADQTAPGGPISFLSQSGAVITAVLDRATEHGLGFNHVVSLGNEALVDEVDVVREWGADPDTDVILAYVEDITRGRAFVDAARDVTQHTPVVLVKSGRTEAGAQAVASHTGAMAGSDRAYEAGIEQSGAIRADGIEELFDFAQILAGQSPPEQDDVAIVTNAGGPGVMATDAVGESRLRLAELSEETQSELDASLPEATSATIPLDILGDAGADRFESVLDTVLTDDAVGSAVVLACPTGMMDYERLAAAIRDVYEAHEKPIVTALMGGTRATRAASRLEGVGIPNFFDPGRAVRSLAVLADYRDRRDREYRPPETFDVDRARARRLLVEAARGDRTRIGAEAMGLLDAYGIETAVTAVVNSPADARTAAAEIGEPVVMKILSPDIPHKSDIGGVEVGVPVDGVADAYDSLVRRAREHRADATILGVAVQERVDLDAGMETILGANRDPHFGPLVLFGLGGIFAEALEDVAVRLAPVSDSEARAMTEEIESAPILRGARGREPVDVDAVVEALQRISQLITDVPAIQELDVNPLVATPEGATAVDLQVTIDPDRLDGA